ncbi:cold adaptation protein ActJcold adaptation protein ActJ [Parashewanella tropica]|uniref:cold adaptation protein ActJcold adaptation protein ActJ n=1 Tax=Parashewanella tropica TaxID=2547970 RepID=UPI001059AD6A|nr:J domain-containing protein [Parashewanella tropica]
MINHFTVLGIKANAKDDEIKKAYKRLSNKYHPDKLINASEEEKQHAATLLQRIQNAYEVLSSPKSRKAFIRDFNNVIVNDPTAAMKELWDGYF